MRRKSLVKAAVVRLLFILYLYVLCKIILFKFGPVHPGFLRERLVSSLRDPGRVLQRMREGNLTPFREIERTMHALSDHGLFNLFGNIAIFIPLGIFLGLTAAGGKLSLTGAFVRSLFASLCLECAQAVFAIGSFDVDDLLLNAIGGVIGCLLFKLAAGPAAGAQASSGREPGPGAYPRSAKPE